MAYMDGERFVVADYVSATERRTVYLRRGAEGMVTIGEQSQGEMTRLAYGDTLHRSELHAQERFVAPVLLPLTGAADLVQALDVLFSENEVSLADLMDELCTHGVEFWFSSLGDVTGPTLRRFCVA